MSVLSCSIIHDTPIEFRGLRVFALLTFVRVMRLPRDDVIGDRVWRLGSVRSEGMLEAVRHVLLVTGMVGVGTHRSVKVETGIVTRHEGAVDRHLVQIDTDAMVLSITVKEHAELKKRVRAIFDTRHQTTGAECRLLHVPMVVLGVLVQD